MAPSAMTGLGRERLTLSPWHLYNEYGAWYRVVGAWAGAPPHVHAHVHVYAYMCLVCEFACA